MSFLSKDEEENEAFCFTLFPGSTYVKNLCSKHDSLILGAKHKEVNGSNTSVIYRLELVWERINWNYVGEVSFKNQKSSLSYPFSKGS